MYGRATLLLVLTAAARSQAAGVVYGRFGEVSTSAEQTCPNLQNLP